jgi:WD40 repeat protein
MSHEDGVYSVAFSRDGQTVLTGSMEGTARLWDASTGQPFGPPMRHGNGVEAVAFSPDGKTVITGSMDDTARLWDVVAEFPDELERVTTWVEALTGLSLDETGSIQILDNAAWLRRREKVKQQGGPPVANAAR